MSTAGHGLLAAWMLGRTLTTVLGKLETRLATVNDQFHAAYDGARSRATYAGPLIVLLADLLVVCHRGKRRQYTYTPSAFHAIKAVTHIPVAIYAALQELNSRAGSAARRKRLDKLHKLITRSRGDLERDGARLALRKSTTRDLHATIDACLAMLERSVAISPKALEQFAGKLGPVLLRLTHEATRLQLESLHACAERALAGMSDSDRAELQVVVAGVHQARTRSVGMQYFRMRLREPEHSEERVAYAEGVSDEREAFALVGTRRLDRAVAGAFFGDPKRLQRDILGDSATALLRDLPLEPIA